MRTPTSREIAAFRNRLRRMSALVERELAYLRRQFPGMDVHTYHDDGISEIIRNMATARNHLEGMIAMSDIGMANDITAARAALAEHEGREG